MTLDADGLDALDLDDAENLLRRKLRPSRVVTRDRRITQRWALAIFEEKRWSGVRWWSYYDPRWGSFGLWSSDRLRVVDVTPLTESHPSVREAATILARPWKEIS